MCTFDSTHEVLDANLRLHCIVEHSRMSSNRMVLSFDGVPKDTINFFVWSVSFPSSFGFFQFLRWFFSAEAFALNRLLSHTFVLLLLVLQSIKSAISEIQLEKNRHKQTRTRTRTRSQLSSSIEKVTHIYFCRSLARTHAPRCTFTSIVVVFFFKWIDLFSFYSCVPLHLANIQTHRIRTHIRINTYDEIIWWWMNEDANLHTKRKNQSQCFSYA